jgi:uncharacterized membrane protein
MAISTNKQLGFVASLLTVLSLIYSFLTIPQSVYPFTSVSPLNFTAGLFFAPLGIIGFILFLIAMYGFSKDYQDNAIFNYVLYGFIASIIIAGLVFAIVVFLLFSTLGSTLLSSATSPSSAQFLQNFLESFLPYFLIMPIIGLIPAFFNMFAFKRLANKSDVRLFSTVGLLGVVAAVVAIVFWFVGVSLFYAGSLSISHVFTLSVASSVVSLVAWTLAIKAYNSIRVPTSQIYSSAALRQHLLRDRLSIVQIAESPTRWTQSSACAAGRNSDRSGVQTHGQELGATHPEGRSREDLCRNQKGERRKTLFSMLGLHEVLEGRPYENMLQQQAR